MYFGVSIFYLSGMCFGVVPATNTKKMCNWKKNWILCLILIIILHSVVHIVGGNNLITWWTQILNEMFIWVLWIMQKVTTTSIWICLPFHIIHMFHIPKYIYKWLTFLYFLTSLHFSKLRKSGSFVEYTHKHNIVT